MKKVRNIMLLSLFLCRLVILAIPMTSRAAKAKLSKTKLNMVVGTQKRLKVKKTTKSIKWTTSKKKVASVSKTGLVTAKKEGVAVISAKFDKKKLSCKVTVKEKPKFERSNINICVGRKQKLVVTGTAKKITWKSSDRKTVKVSKKGVITGLKKGQATITATVGSKKLTCKVKVKAAVKKSDYVFELSNSEFMGLVYHSDMISCKVADETIAKAVLIDYGYDVEENGNSADLYVYGIKDGETTVTLTNNCNAESVTLKIIVKKPTTASAEQQLIDYIILEGVFDEFGDMYVTDGKSRIYYSGAEKYIDYTYLAEVDGNKVEWILMEDVWDEKYVYLVVWIQGSYQIDEYMTARVEKSTYKGEEVAFENAWFGTPAKTEYQELGNETIKQAFAGISGILQQAGLTLSDIGFTSYEV